MKKTLCVFVRCRTSNCYGDIHNNYICAINVFVNKKSNGSTWHNSCHEEIARSQHDAQKRLCAFSSYLDSFSRYSNNDFSTIYIFLIINERFVQVKLLRFQLLVPDKTDRKGYKRFSPILNRSRDIFLNDFSVVYILANN